MTKLISNITGTTNVIINVVTVLTLSFIAFTLLACVFSIDLTILNRAF